MEEKLNIIITSVSKTKNDKTVLNFAYEDKKQSDYRKGYITLQNWFDDLTVFDAIYEEHIGVILEATYTYVPGFNGTARMQISDIFDEDGTSLLS
jgi:hypothetical protein